MYKITPLKYAVHYHKHNPLFGEDVTHVSIDDESNGGFLVLEQDDQKINLDFDELDTVYTVAKLLKRRYECQNSSQE